MRGLRRRALPLLLLFLLSFLFPPPFPSPARAAASEPLTIAVTQPWIALIASFIGGTNVQVLSLQEWGADGGLVRARGKDLKSLREDARIIALDPDDARAVGLKGEYSNLRHLYTSFPIRTSNLDAALSDPSVIPFVAQRVLTVLSGWDPSNYPYYQRRLAEFQARLFSSVLAGQQVLRGVSVYDLSGASDALLKAAGCAVERPDPQQLAEWSRGRTAGLREILEARRAGGVLVVADGATPRPLLKFLNGRPGVFLFGRPGPNQDYPAFLHDQYISLWQMVTAKPQLAAPQKRR